MIPTHKDQEQLHQLSIGHYVMAGISCVFGLIPLIHVSIGLSFVLGKGPFAGVPPGALPAWFGWLFLVVGALAFLIAQSVGVLNVFAARALAARKRRTLCLVAAGFNCFNVPLGTLLGVFTLLVLSRPSVQLLIDQPAPG